MLSGRAFSREEKQAAVFCSLMEVGAFQGGGAGEMALGDGVVCVRDVLVGGDALASCHICTEQGRCKAGQSWGGLLEQFTVCQCCEF